ncbi:MAG: hypothetical protein ABIQ33_13540 [Caldimonas sp.]
MRLEFCPAAPPPVKGGSRRAGSSSVLSDARYDGSERDRFMNLVEKIFAAAIVVACVLLLARMLLKPKRRERVDASLRRSSDLWRGRLRRFIAWPGAELRARRATKEAIRRARRSAIDREGNVISPKAFKGKRRDLH